MVVTVNAVLLAFIIILRIIVFNILGRVLNEYHETLHINLVVSLTFSISL